MPITDKVAMDWRKTWRSATCGMLVLGSTMLFGCAALDLLGGHIPGVEEDPEPQLDPRPYPAPTKAVTRRPATVDQAAPETAAPVVSPGMDPSAPQTPARASLTDAAPPAAEASSPPPPQAATPPNTAPPQEAAPQPPSTTPDTTSSATADPTAAATVPVPEAGTEAKAPQADQPQPKAEPSDEERLAELLQRRDEWIAALEAEVLLRSGKPEHDHELRRMQQQLRLLYLLAERPDEAVTEVESLSAAEQEAYKELMFGLATWLSEEEERRPALRNARVLRSLSTAAGQLAAAAKLDVRNLRFCESVEGFGWYKEFPVPQFRPKQQVILYAEVDHFTTEKKGPDAYETELQVSYQIFDAAGALVDERQLPLDKDVCRNQRRDYFLAYRIYLPDGLGAGKYRLELTVEDLKAQGDYQGRKLGDGLIEFSIRP